LHHDNALARTALSVREVWASNQVIVLEHTPYSPDLAPNDFFLFPKIREILKGRHFDDTDDIKSNTTAALKAIPQQNQFQNCCEGWTRRWHRWKGSTLKAATVIFSNKVCSTLTAMSSRTLLSDNVHWIVMFEHELLFKKIEITNWRTPWSNVVF
jgi:hypothetical protein